RLSSYHVFDQTLHQDVAVGIVQALSECIKGNSTIDLDPVKYLRAKALTNPNNPFKTSEIRANILHDLKILCDGHTHKLGQTWCAKQYKTFKHGKVLEEIAAAHMATNGWRKFLETARAAENQEAVGRMDVNGLTSAMVSKAAKQKRQDVESGSDESSNLSDHTDGTNADPLPEPTDFTSSWVEDVQNAANAEMTHPETPRQDPASITPAQVDDNNSDAGLDEPATPPRVTKLVKTAAAALATPHKLVVLSEMPDSRKLKHKPAAKIVAILRSTRSSISEEYAHLVSKMDEVQRKKYCPESVVEFVRELEKTSIEGNHTARVLAAAMTKEFENLEEMHAFHLASAIANDLVEVQTKATKDVAYAKEPTARTASTYNVDVIGVFGPENAELAFLKQSGGPGAVSRQHALDDSVKVANEGINATRYRLLQFLDEPASDVVKIKSLALQLIGNRFTLLSVGLVGPKTFVITEMKSARMPFGWKDIDMFEDVVDLLLCCIANAREQEQCERDLRKSCRGVGGDLDDAL
ncbi:hypothetical protein HDU86_004342, partial [Geranomyces michiganensis]